MHRSPNLLPFAFVVLAFFSESVVALAQSQSPPGAQPPTSPTQVQNPSPGEAMPEQTPSETRQPVSTPAPIAPGTQHPGVSSPSNSTLPPAPKSPVEPSATGSEAAEPAQQPKTELLDTSDTAAGALSTDGHDPILDPPPFPKGQTTLVGGVISSVDRVRNHMNVAIFGGGHWTVYFDERTHIFRNGVEATQLALKKGERVYVDTMLDNNKHDIFARNIRLGLATAPADASGQIVTVDSNHRDVTFRDSIGAQVVRFNVASDALIRKGSTPASFADLRPGSLVTVKFAPERADRGVAKEISIMAAPGSTFTFSGVVTYLDTHRGIVALRSPGDNKTFDLHFAPAKLDPERKLAVGAEVQAVATFDGQQYTAQQLAVTKAAGASKK